MVVMSQQCGAEKEPLPLGTEPSAAFTPGPWITETTARFVWIGPAKAAGPKVADVVTCITCGGLSAQAEAKVFANARLIASAPDLLEACRRAEPWFLDGPNAATGNLIRAAIAKALGLSAHDTSSATDPLRDADT